MRAGELVVAGAGGGAVGAVQAGGAADGAVVTLDTGNTLNTSVPGSDSGLVHTWLGSELQTRRFSLNLNIRCERFLRAGEVLGLDHTEPGEGGVVALCRSSTLLTMSH